MSFWDCSRSVHIDSLFLLNSSVTIPHYARSVQLSSVQSLSRVQLFAPWIAARQASLSITNSRSSLKLMSIELVMPFSHLILCRPLLLLPPIPPASESFPMSQLFTSGGQSIGVQVPSLVAVKTAMLWIWILAYTCKSFLWNKKLNYCVLGCVYDAYFLKWFYCFSFPTLYSSCH